MFTLNKVDVISVRAVNAERIASGSVEWVTKTENGVVFVEPNESTNTIAEGAKLKFEFFAEVAANYYIWVKARTSTGVSARVWISFDGNYGLFGPNDNGIIDFDSTGFVWSRNGNHTLWTMFAGTHEIELSSFDAALQIEGIVIARTSNTVLSEGSSSAVPLETYGILNTTTLTSESGDNDAPPIILNPLNNEVIGVNNHPFTFIENQYNNVHNSWLFRVGTGLSGVDSYDLHNEIINNPNLSETTVLANTGTVANATVYVRLYWRDPTNANWLGGFVYTFTTSNNVTSNPTPVDVVPTEPTETFQQWSENPLNDKHRLLILELESAESVMYLASHGWVSDENKCYDNWLISVPFIEESLGGDSDLGDIEFVVPIKSENPLTKNWGGYRSRMLLGDDRWERQRFQLISSSNNIDCVLIDERLQTFKLNIIGDSEKFNRVFHVGDDLTQTMIFEEAIDWLMGKWELSGNYTFDGINSSILNKSLRFTVNENTTMNELLELFTVSVDIEYGITQAGQLVFKNPDLSQPDPKLQLDDFNIVKGTMSIIDTQQPAKEVLLHYSEDRSIRLPVASNTGNLSNTVEIFTALNNESDAQELAYVKTNEYSNLRHTYEMDVIGLGASMQTGAVVPINHNSLVSSGYVVSIKRRTLFAVDTLEIKL